MSKQKGWHRVLMAYGTVTKDRKLSVNSMVVYRKDGSVELVFEGDEEGEDDRE